MKTKFILPWNLKVGQRVIQIDLEGQRRSAKVISIKKEKGRFTGRSLWRVLTDDELFSLMTFHGKLNRLPVQKVEVVIESKTN